MSTNCQPTGDSTVKRRNHDGTAQQVPCPPSVVTYNQYMGSVDRGDQYYRVRCKTRKFYRYIFWLQLCSERVHPAQEVRTSEQHEH